jgi:hypothetical protein
METLDEDWEADSKGSGVVSVEQFFRSWFELADVYTDSVDSDEYAAWIESLGDAIIRATSIKSLIEGDGARAATSAADEPPTAGDPAHGKHGPNGGGADEFEEYNTGAGAPASDGVADGAMEDGGAPSAPSVPSTSQRARARRRRPSVGDLELCSWEADAAILQRIGAAAAEHGALRTAAERRRWETCVKRWNEFFRFQEDEIARQRGAQMTAFVSSVVEPYKKEKTAATAAVEKAEKARQERVAVAKLAAIVQVQMFARAAKQKALAAGQQRRRSLLLMEGHEDEIDRAAQDLKLTSSSSYDVEALAPRLARSFSRTILRSAERLRRQTEAGTLLRALSLTNGVTSATAVQCNPLEFRRNTPDTMADTPFDPSAPVLPPPLPWAMMTTKPSRSPAKPPQPLAPPQALPPPPPHTPQSPQHDGRNLNRVEQHLMTAARHPPRRSSSSPTSADVPPAGGYTPWSDGPAWGGGFAQSIASSSTTVAALPQRNDGGFGVGVDHATPCGVEPNSATPSCAPPLSEPHPGAFFVTGAAYAPLPAVPSSKPQVLSGSTSMPQLRQSTPPASW